jgi:putative ABC transport system substrate-binding protein
VAGSTPAALAAKAASSTIPIVFSIGGDPVEFGLVTSLNRPGGNLTGVSFLVNMMASKRFELLHEMLPRAAAIAYLENRANSEMREVQEAARSLGHPLLVVSARTEGEVRGRSPVLSNSEPGELSSQAIRSFMTDAGSSPPWRPVMRCPRSIHFVSTLPSEVS